MSNYNKTIPLWKKYLVFYCVVWVVFLSLAISATGKESKPLIFGVKMIADPKPYAQNFALLKNAGINALFADETLMADESFRIMARQNGMKLFLVIRAFLLDSKIDSLLGVCDNGLLTYNQTEEGSWLNFACPNNKTVRQKTIEKVKAAVKLIQPDVLSIDFIRFYIFWEAVLPSTPAAKLQNSCFCPVCMEKFQTDTKVKIPHEIKDAQLRADWISKHVLAKFTAWKCTVIAGMVDEIVAAGRQEKPDLLFNLHAIPWRTKDFNQGIRRIVGQDFVLLGKKVDYLSPMCYSSMTGNTPAWVATVIKQIYRTAHVRILPSIQVKKEYSWEKEYSPAQFEKALRAALKKPSQGVVFYDLASLLKDTQRLEIVQKILTSK